MSQEDASLEEMLKQLIHNPVKTVNKLILSTIGIVTLLVVGICLYCAYRSNSIAAETKAQIELSNKYYVIQNQQTVLLKIVDQKMSSLGVDQKAQITKTIYDWASIKQIPLYIVCGIIEVESGWNICAKSNMGAEGLMQIMPLYARPYLREFRLDYKKDIYSDPCTNIQIGISMLRDYHNENIEKGRTTEDNYIPTLHNYFWGPSNTNQLYGKQDTRVNVPNLAYPQRIIDAAKKYKDMGL